MAPKMKVKTKGETKGEAADETLTLEERILKEHGGDIIPFSQDTSSTVSRWIRTGSYRLDKILSNGKGIPVGRVVTLVGKKSSGKSTIAAKIIAAFQRAGGLVVLMDTEYSFDPIWAVLNGVDIDGLMICQPPHIEDVFEKIESLLKMSTEKNPDRLILIVWDSIAMTPCKSELESEDLDGGGKYGEHSRLISKGSRKIFKYIGNNNATLLLINQLKTNISGYGEDSTYIGKIPLDYISSIIVETKQNSKEKDTDDNIYAIRSGLKTTKNKLSPPFKETVTSIAFDKGLDTLWESLQVAKDEGRVIQSGAWNKIVVPCTQCDREEHFDKRTKTNVIVTTGKKEKQKCESCKGEGVVPRDGFAQFYESGIYALAEKHEGLEEFLAYGTGPLAIEDTAKPKFLY